MGVLTLGIWFSMTRQKYFACSTLTISEACRQKLTRRLWLCKQSPPTQRPTQDWAKSADEMRSGPFFKVFLLSSLLSPAEIIGDLLRSETSLSIYKNLFKAK